MKYIVGGIAVGAGIPLFLVGCLTLNPVLATGGAFATMAGLSQFDK